MHRMLIGMTQPRYFHGTVARNLVGKTITPARNRGGQVLYQGETDPDYAYATTSEAHGWDWAEKAYFCADKGIPRVYEVEPVDMGSVEKDPEFYANGSSRGNFEDDVRSTRGFRVIREVPMPENLVDQYDEN